MQGTWVRSLVGEPRAHRLQGNEASIPTAAETPTLHGRPRADKKDKSPDQPHQLGPGREKGDLSYI